MSVLILRTYIVSTYITPLGLAPTVSSVLLIVRKLHYLFTVPARLRSEFALGLMIPKFVFIIFELAMHAFDFHMHLFLVLLFFVLGDDLPTYLTFVVVTCTTYLVHAGLTHLYVTLTVGTPLSGLSYLVYL